jgi:3-oxoacid CoA-transferase A subunit
MAQAWDGCSKPEWSLLTLAAMIGENKLLEKMLIEGKISLTLVPQSTFAERIRAAGAGIPAFYTPTGVGTVVAEGKEVREFDGRAYVLEHALKADFALIKAWRGDRLGNLVSQDGSKFQSDYGRSSSDYLCNMLSAARAAERSQSK